MNKFLCKYLVVMLLLQFFSCGEKPQPTQVVPRDAMKNSMEKANRYLVADEEKEIEGYIARHGLVMNSTGTGMRYAILEQGSQQPIRKGEKVSMEFELKLITGDVVYSSEKEGVKTFVVGGGTVESGLDEAMVHLHRGDVATVIIPSHLGYGFHGDDRSIPGYATLIYRIKINENQ